MTEDEGRAGSRRNSALVTAGIGLSRISGFVREKLTAYYLGSGFAVEAFRAALRIPNLLQNLLGEGVLSASFIPVYSRLLSEGREEEAGRVAGAVAGLLAVVSGSLVLLGVVFAEPITSVIATGFPRDSAKFELTVTLVRIITPGIGFLVLSAWCLGVLNSHRRFFLSYVAPVLWNAGMIAALVTFGLRGVATRDLAVALGWGTFVGSLLQFLVQLRPVLRSAQGLRFRVTTAIPGVRRVLAAFGPVVAGRGVVQVSAYVDTVLASFLATGSFAALAFAQTLYVLPISLFGMSVAAAELPELSSVEEQDRRRVQHRLADGLARIAFYVVPSAVVFIVVGDEVVGLLYQGGEFGALATRQVWLVLIAYSLGLLPSTATRLLQSSLYGMGDTRRPAILASIRVLLSGVVGVVLMLQLDQFRITATGIEQLADLPSFAFAEPAARAAEDNLLQLGAVGLAIGSAIGSWFEYLALRRVVAREIGLVQLGGGRLPRTLLAATAATVVAGAMRFVVAGLHPALGAPIAAGLTGLAYLAAARRLGLDEAVHLTARILRRHNR
ncbi:MAG TPA: murein biosynthesis integral membrane protein MurJ [Nitriliruptorales bacterium]